MPLVIIILRVNIKLDNIAHTSRRPDKAGGAGNVESGDTETGSVVVVVK